MANKKVLFLFTSVEMVGGIQRFNRNVLDAVSDMDDEVEYDVISLLDSQLNFAYGKNLADAFYAKGSKIRFLAEITKRVLTRRYQVIVVGHLHLLIAALIARCSILNSFSRVLLFCHGVEIWDRLGLRHRVLFSSLSRVLAVSSYTKQSIIKQLGKKLQIKIDVFPNTLAKDWYDKQQDVFITEKSVAPAEILVVSRLDRSERAKGIDTLIRAIGVLEKDCHLNIVGSGNDIDYLRLIVDELGLGHRVSFLSGITDEELIGLYKEAVCFCLPSDKEGFGIVFLEAMFYKCPVIGANSKGITDVIDHKVTGLLVEYGNVDELAGAISSFLEDQNLRERCVINAYEKIAPGGEFSFQLFRRRLFGVING